MTARLSLLALFGALALTGCDKDTEEDTSTVVPPTWPEMDESERTAYMASTVLPKMTELFQAYDAETYADFGCETCHTDGGDYTMPSQDLAGYWEEGEFPGPETDDPGVQFMHQEVLPTMAELLDNDSPSCVGCHIE